MTEPLTELVTRAQAGDLDAFGRLVRMTQAMVHGVARGVLRDPTSAQDAVQDAYLSAFRRLRGLEEPAAFVVWLRRIVITTSLNLRRSRRRTLLRLDDVPEVPILDEAETRWTDLQRERLAGALLTLTAAEAQAAAADSREAAKGDRDVRTTRPASGRTPARPARAHRRAARAAAVDGGFDSIELPEFVDLREAVRTVGQDALYVDPIELQRVDDGRILRYDLTLPLLMQVRYHGRPLRLFTAGKCYRQGRLDAMHLDAFHQAETFWLDDRARLTPWMVTAAVLQSVDAILPGRTVKIVPTQYAMCTQAWELEVETDGRWSEVLAWGVFTDKIVAHVGGDPARHTAIGAGRGLERLAMIRYGIDDIRKIEAAQVA